MITSDFSELFNIKFKVYREGKYKLHINNIMSFDIETSTGFRLSNGNVIPFSYKRCQKFYARNERRQALGRQPLEHIPEYENPVAMMYVWQFAIEDGNDTKVFIGRTWDEFRDFIDTLDLAIGYYHIYGNSKPTTVDKDYFAVAIKGKPCNYTAHLYIHNLAFEFQFLRNVFPVIRNLFARESRKPMRFDVRMKHSTLTFHDTLCLTQKKLEKWASDEQLPVQKTHDLDYHVIRTPQTPLKPLEVNYIVNDVLIIVEGIKKYRQKYHGKLSNIPMTQTGEVRLVCRRNVSLANYNYADLCYTIDHNYSFEFFNLLVQAFAGGWTHANQKYSGILQHNVRCFDFASSYPSVMTSFKGFPMSEFEEVDPTILPSLEANPFNDRDKCFMIDVSFDNIESTVWNTYWSTSKCLELSEDAVSDNGKLVCADHVRLVITDLDFDTIKKCYDYDSMTINHLYTADCGYLPVEMILTILDYFKDKTALKGTGQDSKYNAAKQFINGIYGCCVMKVIADIVGYSERNDDWYKEEIDEETFMKLLTPPDDPLKRDRQVKKQFTTYQQGVWVTACARHRLFEAVLHFDEKTVYCDTDSIKGLFDDDDLKWFDEYNAHISELQEKCAAFYNFPVARYTEKTAKGKYKQLGIFEREDDAVEFKALRAKVYAAAHPDKNGNLEIETTIAGLPKSSGVAKLSCVDDLQTGLFWWEKESKKLTSYYLDTQQPTVWHDKHGNIYKCEDKFGVALIPTSFSLELTDEYEELLGLIDGERDNDYFNITKIIRDFEIK